MKKLAWLIVYGCFVCCGCAEDPNALPAPSEKTETPKTDQAAKSGLDHVLEPLVLDDLREMRNGLREGQPQVLWYSLPTDFRDDVESLVHEFADRVDEELWRNAFASWRKVQRILDHQSGMILALPELEELNSTEQDRLRQRMNVFAGLLELLVDSDLASLSKLRRISIGEFLKKNGAELLSSAEKIDGSSQLSLVEGWIFPTDADPHVLAEDEQTARIGWTRDGEETPIRVELWIHHGRTWMPANWLVVWEQVRLARRELQSTTEPLGAVADRLQSLRAADGVLTELLSAKTAAEFTQVWQRDVSDEVRSQIIGQLLSWAGVENPLAKVESTADEDSNSTDNSRPTPITNATQADYVTIEVQGKLDEQAEDVLFLALEAAIAGDADVLQLPGKKNWTSQVGPVRDVSEFAKRLRIGRLVEIDSEKRRIVLEWTDPTGFRTPD